MIQSNLLLESYGWLYGDIQIENQKVDFTVSYLCDGIDMLLQSLINVNPEFHTIGNRKPLQRSSFIWVGEPEEWEWKIIFTSFDLIKIQIKKHNIWDSKNQKAVSKIVLKQQCNYFEFATAFVNNVTVLIQKHGIIGYCKTWGSEFPLHEFLEFKHYIKTKTIFISECLEGLNPQERCSDTYKSDLQYEFKLLTEIL